MNVTKKSHDRHNGFGEYTKRLMKYVLSTVPGKGDVGEDHFFFFFQAEDGIRDVAVTGVQTCALPILADFHDTPSRLDSNASSPSAVALRTLPWPPSTGPSSPARSRHETHPRGSHWFPPTRSEERRVGKECRYQWVRVHDKEKGGKV